MFLSKIFFVFASFLVCEGNAGNVWAYSGYNGKQRERKRERERRERERERGISAGEKYNTSIIVKYEGERNEKYECC